MFNGEKLKLLFEEKKIQQNAFCEETGISKSNLWVWVKGDSKPGADALEKIADYFNLPIDYFFDRECTDASIGHHINGNGNKVIGDITLSEYKQEIEHLRALIAEKERIISEKERTIKILMDK